MRTAVGTIPAAPLVLLEVMTEEGITGRSYLFGYIPTSLAPIVKLVDQLAVELKGKPVVPLERMREFDLRFRLLGMQGLVGMVVSGLDMAFWDILGKAADVPVVQLLGGSAEASTWHTTAWEKIHSMDRSTHWHSAHIWSTSAKLPAPFSLLR